MNSNLDDLSLLALLQSNDDNAINKGVVALYRSYYQMVTKMVTSNSGTAADAQDLFQEMLVKQFLPKVRRADFMLTGKLSSLIFVIARNMWLKELRNQHALPDSIDWYAEDGNAIDDIFAEKHEIIADIIKNMRGNCPKIIVMKHERGENHATIAQFLQVTEDTAKVNLSRCMKKLRELIAAHPFFKNR